MALSAWVLASCAAPTQQGGVVVAPGAGERFMLAMSMGYLGSFDRAMVPGQVRRALLRDQLPSGPAATAKVGDYVLENGHLLAAVTNVDGTTRGGRLVDLARKPTQADGLDGLELEVLGEKVVYDALKTGRDEATFTAYVEVSGRIDATHRGGPLVTVSTRYDVAPGVDAIVVSTHIKLERGAFAEGDSAPSLFDETLVAKSPMPPIADVTAGFGATLGDGGGYLLRPMSDGASLTTTSISPRVRVPATQGPALGDAIVVTRVVSPLERADSSAVAVALAKTDGKGIGDIEVRVAPRGPGARYPKRGDLSFVSASGESFLACDLDATGDDSHFAASMPEGRYTMVFRNGALESEGVPVVIEKDRTGFTTVAAAVREKAEPTPPGPSACISPASHDPPR